MKRWYVCEDRRGKRDIDGTRRGTGVITKIQNKKDTIEKRISREKENQFK